MVEIAPADLLDCGQVCILFVFQATKVSGNFINVDLWTSTKEKCCMACSASCGHQLHLRNKFSLFHSPVTFLSDRCNMVHMAHAHRLGSHEWPCTIQKPSKEGAALHTFQAGGCKRIGH